MELWPLNFSLCTGFGLFPNSSKLAHKQVESSYMDAVDACMYIHFLYFCCVWVRQRQRLAARTQNQRIETKKRVWSAIVHFNLHFFVCQWMEKVFNIYSPVTVVVVVFFFQFAFIFEAKFVQLNTFVMIINLTRWSVNLSSSHSDFPLGIIYRPF